MRQDRKPTFKEILNQVAAGNVNRLINRARTANRLAKLTCGKARRSAYCVKNDVLVTITCRFPDRVTIRKDLRTTELFVINFKKPGFGLHIPASEFASRWKGQRAA